MVNVTILAMDAEAIAIMDVKECVMVMQVHHAEVLHAQDVAEWVVQALAMDSATRNVITENNIRYQC